MGAKKILIGEDDEAIQELIHLYLDENRYEPIFAKDGEEVLRKFYDYSPDLILLDINMPKRNGFEVCIEIRKSSLVPIIFVTSRDEPKDIVEGLMVGADDYVSKPFNMEILLARMEANLRYKSQLENQSNKLMVNNLEFDYEKYQVRKSGQEVYLHPRELDLLFYLVTHKNKVISAERLYEEVWQADSFGDTLTVSVHISRIRSKIEDDPREPKKIKTVKGKGYMFVEE
ncbi:response regulator transcription factor [Bacillaceae bacterium S4-13-58]